MAAMMDEDGRGRHDSHVDQRRQRPDVPEEGLDARGLEEGRKVEAIPGNRRKQDQDKDEGALEDARNSHAQRVADGAGP
ncbi:MAG: hypothetical protein MUE76_07475 [Syntrophales bacterium]|nr:hypothetical protein [Syntrophales bacterium]